MDPLTVALIAILSLACGPIVTRYVILTAEHPLSRSFLAATAIGSIAVVALVLIIFVNGAAPFVLAPQSFGAQAGSPFWPLHLVIAAVALVGFLTATITDIFCDRSILAAAVVYPTRIILIAYALAIPFISYGAFVVSLSGWLLCWGLGLILEIPARYLARRNKAPIDELTGEQVEYFGGGDTWLLKLMGALLGPVGGLTAFALGAILNGIVSVPLLLRDRLSGRGWGLSYQPFVPGLAVAAIYVLVSRPL
jgi:hypothetical protein